ncbi:MAG: tetratricopeptide repeat protein [Bacteroidetes bacterium]|nr:tetratricopeptide repeat protein [Bacteroidota bacterium]
MQINVINTFAAKFIFVVIALAFDFNVFADNGRKIDSLYTIIKTSKNDTVKINAQLKIASLLMKEDSVKGYHEVKKAYYTLNSLSPNNFVFRAFEKMAKICKNNGMFQKARIYWDLGLARAKSEKNPEWQARFYMRIADHMQSEDLSKQCITYFDSALTIAKTGDEKLLSDILMKKGRAHYDNGDYKTAMDNYIESQRLFEKNKWRSEEFGHLLHFIGSVFKRQNFREKALDYYEKELALAREIKIKSLEAEALYLSAAMYGELGNLDKELEYEQRSLELYRQEGREGSVALLLTNISHNYASKGDYKKAIINCEEALEILKRNGDISKESFIYRSLGSYYSKLGQHQKAIAYLKMAMEIASKVETKQLLYRSEITEALAFAYSEMKDYKSAFNTLLEHRYLNDSLDNQSNAEYLSNLEKQYDTEKKEKEIALQKVELDKSNAVVKQQATQRNAMIAGCILVLIIAGISIVAFINKRKTSRLLSKQVNEINYQNAIIKEKNKDITDSIQYAKRLQEAVFPETDVLNTFFAESFVLFRPKDIVSGDFYWFEEVGDKTIIVVGDCTGHGVPGAFMSILGHNLLNQIILEEGTIAPGRILNILDKRVTNALNKRESKEANNDGMDMVICVIDKAHKKLTYAGANRPLVIRRAEQLIELKPDKHAIGGVQDSTCKLFTQQEINIQDEDVMYMFSDGYYDQFGGPKGKKFKYKQLTGHILSMASKPLEEQKKILSDAIITWQGNLEQVDDICVIGIKI